MEEYLFAFGEISVNHSYILPNTLIRAIQIEYIILKVSQVSLKLNNEDNAIKIRNFKQFGQWTRQKLTYPKYNQIRVGSLLSYQNSCNSIAATV